MKWEQPKRSIALLVGFFACCHLLHAQDTLRKADGPIVCSFGDEEMPMFRGGYAAFTEFVSTCIIYPDTARLNGIAGKVFVSFIVDRTGSVTDVQVLRGIGYGCDEEAMRVIRFTDGNWTPSSSDGKPVKVKFNIPIHFKLQ